jgi:hypothetical protein
MNNATRRLAMLVVLSFALRHSARAQTTTTNTDCTINGSTANCTSTSTDDSAQRQAQAAAQAEKDRQAEELGKSAGNAMGGLVGLAMRKHAIGKQYKAYCNQHPGESWARRDAKGTVLDQGTCPGTLSRQQVIDSMNKSFLAQNVVGYAEVSGDTLIDHSERASEMRFHMLLNQQMLDTMHTINIKTFVYTNDKDQKYMYDVVTGHVVSPSTPAGATSPAAASSAAPLSAPEARPLVDAESSSTVASTLPPSVPVAVPAAPSSPAAPPPCNNVLRDKSGHEVCLDQH